MTDRGASLTTRQIAEAAGVAEGTLFRVFPDKRALCLAAAEHALRPPHWREDLAAAMAAQPALHGKVVDVAGRMQERMRQVMAVMMALRTAMMDDPGHRHTPGEPPGPPAFFADAARELLEALADLVFAPHADELRVAPDVAALALRNLVMGGVGPGSESSPRLTPDQVADLLLTGVRA